MTSDTDQTRAGGGARSVHELTASGTRPSPVPTPRRRWLSRAIIPVAILLAAAVMLVYAAWDRVMPTTPVRVVPIVVKTVQGQGAGSVLVQAPGWVEPDPHPYFASALTEGIVEDILVLEGQDVKAGQPVARMVDDDAQLALDQAEATLQQRQAELDAARASSRAAERTFEHLIAPRQALTVAEARCSEIDAELVRLEADILAERAVLAEIEDELSRKRTLVDIQAVSEAEVRRLELRCEAQKAEIKAAGAKRDVLRAQHQRADADLAAAQENLELLIDEQQELELARAGVGRSEAAVQFARAVRGAAQLRLDRMVVRAPVDGVVMTRLASPGSKLTIGGEVYSAHVVHIYDPGSLQVRVDVPIADAAGVGVGQLAEVVVDVLPDRVFTGRVTRAVHEADIAKNTIEVKVAIDDPIPQLKPEMLARVRFLQVLREGTGGGELRQRVFAPAELLQVDGEGGARALVVSGLRDDRGRVEQRIVTLGGMRLEGWREVVEGLRPGDLLVANPPATLQPGDRVRVLGESHLQALAGGL